MTEAALREAIRELCKLYDWEFQFWHDSRHSPAGFPDLVLGGRRKQRMTLIFAELKSERGRLTRAQEKWKDILSEVGTYSSDVRYYVWKPSQLQEIVDILAGKKNA